MVAIDDLLNADTAGLQRSYGSFLIMHGISSSIFGVKSYCSSSILQMLDGIPLKRIVQMRIIRKV